MLIDEGGSLLFAVSGTRLTPKRLRLIPQRGNAILMTFSSSSSGGVRRLVEFPWLDDEEGRRGAGVRADAVSPHCLSTIACRKY